MAEPQLLPKRSGASHQEMSSALPTKGQSWGAASDSRSPCTFKLILQENAAATLPHCTQLTYCCACSGAGRGKGGGSWGTRPAAEPSGGSGSHPWRTVPSAAHHSVAERVISASGCADTDTPDDREQEEGVLSCMVLCSASTPAAAGSAAAEGLLLLLTGSSSCSGREC